MLRALLVLVVLTSAATAPAYDRSKDAQDEIVDYVFDNKGTGDYYFRYETKNGLRREETGVQVNVGEPDQHIVVRGEYSFIDPAGKLHVIKYTSDENGYQVLGPSDDFGQGAGFGGAVPGPILATLLGG